MKTIREGELEIEYTAKPLSGWGGVTLLFEFARKVGFLKVLDKTLPSKKQSQNQVSSTDIAKTLMAAVMIGANRFAHVDRVRGDEVLRQIMGAERVGGADSVRRYFASLTRGEGEELYQLLQKAMSELLSDELKEDVVDLDSTILERYGRQQGVSKGYHSSRAGQLSHHPLLGMLARSKHIVHVWLRAGGASTMRGAKEFVDELVTRLPTGFKISAIRADSGFYTEEFLRSLEAKKLDYIVAVRMHSPMQKLSRRVPEKEWRRLDDEHEIADVQHQAHNWSHTRRLLIVRRSTRHETPLFETITYEYSALVTTLAMPAEQCSTFYDQRGACENTIKEFKNDFGADGFCMHSFDATEVVLRFLSILFNLVTEFKRRVLRDTTVTLGTIRVKIFVLGAILGRRARQTMLRLGLRRQWKDDFQTLLDRAFTQNPTAAQLAPSP